MITAVDTSVLLDIFGADPRHGLRSKEAFRACRGEGSLVACEIVWAEVASFFESAEAATDSLDRLGIEFSPIEVEAAMRAAGAWKAYRNRRGHRTRMIPDFLIGAHAQCQADRLLTRDRGFHRTYFSRLRVLDPAL